MIHNQIAETSLEQARSRAKAREWTTDRVVRELDRLDLIDQRFIGHCRTMREELVPALLGAMHESRGTAKLNASLLLLHLGDCRGTEGIVQCLRSDDEELQRKTLLRVTFLPLEPFSADSWPSREPPVPLDAQPLFREIERFLAQPDTRTGILALETAMKLDLPEVEECVRPLLKHPSRKVRTDVLNRWYARRCLDQGAFQVAQELLFDQEARPDDNYWVIAALEAYCKCDSRELTTAAAELLARFVRANVNYPGNSMTNRRCL